MGSAALRRQDSGGAALPFLAPAAPLPRPRAPIGGNPSRIGVIHNALARHNIGRLLPRVVPGCDHVMPASHGELREVLAGFVTAGVGTLIVDGGDGTVRDIVSALVRDFPDFRPRIAVVPSGKTNALALDLGIPADWTLAAAIEAAAVGHTAERGPIEVWRPGADGADRAGFLFGSGAFVRATRTAQQTHRFGAFNGLAVGLSILAGIGQTLFGGKDNPWRRGERMRVAVDAGDVSDAPHYLFFASTLTRLPLGVKPLGPTRAGLKLLRVEAPARKLARAAPLIIAGRDTAWLRAAGYHHADAQRIDLSFAGDFVLDGETFEGGELSLRQGTPIRFIVP